MCFNSLYKGKQIPFKQQETFFFYRCSIHNIMCFNSLYKGKQIPFKQQETFLGNFFCLQVAQAQQWLLRGK